MHVRSWGACQLLGVTGRAAHLPAMTFIPKPLPALFTVPNAVDGLSSGQQSEASLIGQLGLRCLSEL